MSLQEQLAEDLDIFFDLEELAGLHTINGRELLVIQDDDRLELIKSGSGYADNVFAAKHLLYIKAGDLGMRPVPETLMDFDGKRYKVSSVSGELVYQIILGAIDR